VDAAELPDWPDDWPQDVLDAVAMVSAIRADDVAGIALVIGAVSRDGRCGSVMIAAVKLLAAAADEFEVSGQWFLRWALDAQRRT
jgi:hypothetical protein